jgi:23S rRNA maturation-related 3'-5' exoribonuclease YhaM
MNKSINKRSIVMKLFTKNIRANEEITTFLALTSLQLKTSKKKQQQYLKLALSDKTGMITGYLWNDPVETATNIKENTVVKIKAFSQAWNDSVIMNVERIRTAEDRKSVV